MLNSHICLVATGMDTVDLELLNILQDITFTHYTDDMLIELVEEDRVGILGVLVIYVCSKEWERIPENM